LQRALHGGPSCLTQNIHQALEYKNVLDKQVALHKDLFSPPVADFPENFGHALHVRWRRRSDCLGPHV